MSKRMDRCIFNVRALLAGGFAFLGLRIVLGIFGINAWFIIGILQFASYFLFFFAILEIFVCWVAINRELKKMDDELLEERRNRAN